MTYSIVSFHPHDGSLGFAAQSHFFAVGSVVGDAEAGVGVVVSQAFANTDWPHEGLSLLRAGATPDDVLATLIAGDPLADYRQAIVMDATGAYACFTGGGCAPHTGVARGQGVAAVGNMLASDDVCRAMVAAHGDSASGSAHASRLVSALLAGEDAGGDARGSQSAVVKVVDGVRGERPWRHVLADIRVDDHADPVGELRRLLPIHEGFRTIGAALFAPPLVIGDASGIAAAEAREMVRALAAAAAGLGGNPEADLWRAVILLRSGEVDAGGALLAELGAARPHLGEFARGLERVGILPKSEVRP
ncbi:DUF1028 domain-containing protein [Embleya scabrispora]|uniref:DUF1028 domain-containing protein n=1 Tax=Embleya scabrispora TaxID=159449 RepID=UPI0003A99C2B|nr:DUF1028 domain-containing protein [Embleya scabrispora]MYS84921.1 DUF1028 domain-containing protein [Streptomyces sp. SID5474]